MIKIIKEKKPYLEEKKRFPVALYIIILLYIAGISIFINFPLLFKSDVAFHTGSPAAVVSKINAILLNKFNIKYLRIFYFICLFLTGIILFQLKKIISNLKINFIKLVSILFVFLLSYCLFLTYKIDLTQFGRIELLHRYPPLGKTVFAFFYFLLGISNYGGRVSQIIFNIFTIIYLYKMNFGNSKRTNFFVIILYAFNPLIWNIMYYNFLDIGTIFFITVIVYYFINFYKFKDKRNLCLFWIFFIAGLMYKRLVLFVFVVLFFIYLLDLLFNAYKKNIIKEFLEIISIPLIFFLPYFIYDKIFHISPSGILYKQLVNIPAAFFLQLFLLPSYVGISLSILFFVSIIFVLFRLRKERIIKFGIIYLLVCVFFISISGAWTFIRHILPIIMILSVFSGLLLNSIYKKNKIITILIIIIVLIEGIYINFLDKNALYINFNTVKYYYVPFEELSLYIKKNKLYKKKIYAPNTTEPSQFYFYKNNIPLDNYERKLWVGYDSQNIQNLTEYLKNNKFDYFIVPGIYIERETRLQKYYLKYFADYIKKIRTINPGHIGSSEMWNDFIQKEVHREILNRYDEIGLFLEKKFSKGNNSIYLFKIKK